MPEALAAKVRNASSHTGPWPIVSVWHGTSDATVDPSNGRAIVDQWRIVHGAPVVPSRTDKVDGYPHRVWSDGQGREVVEEYLVTGMGHGTPLSSASAFGETAGPFMLEAGISSTQHIARFWGLGEAPSLAGQLRMKPVEAGTADTPTKALPSPARSPEHATTGVQKTIEDALRTAGLMR
jgi:hypothetical protein